MLSGRPQVLRCSFAFTSQRTYERWIDQYLDPFMVCMQRERVGLKLRNNLEPSKTVLTASEPGEEVQGDCVAVSPGDPSIRRASSTTR